MQKSKGKILVIFGEDKGDMKPHDFGRLLTGDELEALIDSGDVYAAGEFLESLPKIELQGNLEIPKLIVYKGYELWWTYYNSFFYFFALPYTRYKRLLGVLQEYNEVYLYNPPNKYLFTTYLESHGSRATISGGGSERLFTLGIVLQVILTLISLPILMILRHPVLVFTGDKFEPGKDCDFRLKLIYRELRHRRIPFVEFIRSLEGSRNILTHAWRRMRPVVYSEALALCGRVISIITLGNVRTRRKLREVAPKSSEPYELFKTAVAMQYLYVSSGDVWSIRIHRLVEWLIGVKVAYVTAANERNMHTVLAAKIGGRKTVGILHGISSRYSTPYDFFNGFGGEKTLSVDYYGLWSEWWREKYINESDAYRPEQLVISGPMRPVVGEVSNYARPSNPRVLLVAEQAATPEEVIPYIDKLIEEGIDLTIKFRPTRDGFESWLLEHRPDILNSGRAKTAKSPMQEAIKNSDVVIGCHSTGVLEALLLDRVPIFMNTNKWKDYFEMSKSEETKRLFAKDPDELAELIRTSEKISLGTIQRLREKYFGDSSINGSAWVVDMLEKFV